MNIGMAALLLVGSCTQLTNDAADASEVSAEQSLLR